MLEEATSSGGGAQPIMTSLQSALSTSNRGSMQMFYLGLRRCAGGVSQGGAATGEASAQLQGQDGFELHPLSNDMFQVL